MPLTRAPAWFAAITVVPMFVTVRVLLFVPLRVPWPLRMLKITGFPVGLPVADRVNCGIDGLQVTDVIGVVKVIVCGVKVVVAWPVNVTVCVLPLVPKTPIPAVNV